MYCLGFLVARVLTEWVIEEGGIVYNNLRSSYIRGIRLLRRQ